MHFTIVFDSQEGYDLTAGLVFRPVPMWVAGGEDLMVLRRDHADYERGDVQRLLGHPAMQRPFPPDSRAVVVVVHESGYGTERDLVTLVADLTDEGHDVTTVPCKAERS